MRGWETVMSEYRKVPFVTKEKLEEIIADVPTPFHIYDEKGIRENARAVKEAFAWNKGFREYFAVKATPTPALIHILGEYDCGCDCSSMTELMLSEAMGFDGNHIMFSSNDTPAEEYQKAYDMGAIINLDDITAIDVFEKKVGKFPKRMCCRFNPGGLFAMSNGIMDNPGDSKYGMTTEQLFEAFRILKSKGVEEFGVHAFLCSNTVTNEYYPKLADILFRLAVKLQKETGCHITFINLSGGVGIPYEPWQEPNDIRAIGAGVEEVYNKILVPAGMGDVSIYTEMGRFMMGPYGGLVTKCINQKHIYKEYIGVDACACNLMRPAMYGAYHHITVMGKENADCDHKYDVTGSLCENNDKFAVDRMLPEINVGDILFIHDTGAHGFSMGYNYNGKLWSAEILLKEDGSWEMIRRPETPKDYFATLDFTPEYKKMFGDA
jgi:diaminopimelate decarboxylase